jgi:hypothetical protein
MTRGRTRTGRSGAGRTNGKEAPLRRYFQYGCHPLWWKVSRPAKAGKKRHIGQEIVDHMTKQIDGMEDDFFVVSTMKQVLLFDKLFLESTNFLIPELNEEMKASIFHEPVQE